ncbi:hypothetical protein B7494_g4226 [Chlorociboria aeruginascens]|nr:hypothetical protein B7494_g4226 [Chlorociboria aeruginascens]
MATPKSLPGEITRPSFPWREERGLVSYGLPFSELASAHVERFGKTRIFAVVSASLAKNTDLLQSLKTVLGEKIVGVHLGVKSHTPWDDVWALVVEARECDPDLILTLGGGSITDAVKAVSLCLANPHIDSIDGLSSIWVKPSSKDANLHDIPINSSEIKPASIKMINIPTTLSAGEYSPYCGVTDPRDNIKRMFVHNSIFADVVILHPELGTTVPEWVWMSSGVRSIDHCVETLASLLVNDEEVITCAQKGLVLVARGLLKLRKDPNDHQSRLDTQIGSNYAIDSICRGIPLGGSHAIGHQLGPFGVAHGHTSCVICPAIMKYNASVNSERQKLALDALWNDDFIAQVLSNRGLSSGRNDLGDTLDGLFREYGMPRTLKEVGVEGDKKLQELATQTLTEAWCQTNPIPITTETQVLEILRAVEG